MRFNLKTIVQDAILQSRLESDYYTLVARAPFTDQSDAMFIDADGETDGYKKSLLEGYSYFLDSEDMSPIFQYANEKRLSDDKVIELAIYYATYDAYPAWTNE